MFDWILIFALRVCLLYQSSISRPDCKEFRRTCGVTAGSRGSCRSGRRKPEEQVGEGLEAEAPGGSSPAVRPPVRGVDQCDDPAGTGQPLFRLPTALHQAAQPPSPAHQVCKSKGREKASPGRPPSPLWAHPTTPNIPPLGGAIQAHKKAGEKVCSLVGQVSS